MGFFLLHDERSAGAVGMFACCGWLVGSSPGALGSVVFTGVCLSWALLITGCAQTKFALGRAALRQAACLWQLVRTLWEGISVVVAAVLAYACQPI